MLPKSAEESAAKWRVSAAAAAKVSWWGVVIAQGSVIVQGSVSVMVGSVEEGMKAAAQKSGAGKSAQESVDATSVTGEEQMRDSMANQLEHWIQVAAEAFQQWDRSLSGLVLAECLMMTQTSNPQQLGVVILMRS